MAAAATAARSLGNPAGGINNTAYLFFILALAFLFYVTIKGDLPKWLGLFGLGPSTGSSATSPAGTAAVSSGLPGLPALPQIGQTAGVGNLPATSNPFGNTVSDASNPLTYG